MKTRETIVKVQMPPSMAPATDQRLLVFAEGRKMMAFHAPESEILDKLRGDATGFFKAVWAGHAEGWLIGDRVPDQFW
jgi:hypothetical protein